MVLPHQLVSGELMAGSLLLLCLKAAINNTVCPFRPRFIAGTFLRDGIFKSMYGSTVCPRCDGSFFLFPGLKGYIALSLTARLIMSGRLKPKEISKSMGIFPFQ